MIKETVLEKLLKQNEGRHLGDLCGWGIHGEHLQTEVKIISERLGISEDLGLPYVSASSAYRRAVNDAVKSGRSDERKLQAVKVEDTETKIVHAVVRSLLTEAPVPGLSSNDADFEQILKVGFDKDGYKNGRDPSVLLQTENDDHALSAKIRARYEELCVRYLPRDIRVAFQRAFEKWGAIRLLDHGGLWWVPAPYAEKVRAWKTFMGELNNTTVIIPVFDTEETINSLREQSRQTLEAQLSEMMGDLEKFSKTDSTRVSTLEKRLEMFDSLRTKIELHAAVLGMKQQELLDRLNDAKDGLAAAISGLA